MIFIFSAIFKSTVNDVSVREWEASYGKKTTQLCHRTERRPSEDNCWAITIKQAKGGCYWPFKSRTKVPVSSKMNPTPDGLPSPWLQRVSARGRASGSGVRAATLPTPVLGGPLARATGATTSNTRPHEAAGRHSLAIMCIIGSILNLSSSGLLPYSKPFSACFCFDPQ